MESKLINNENKIIAIYKIEKYPINIDGKIYKVVGWNKSNEPVDFTFFANAWVKWDNCSHFRFYGEDHDEEEKEIDPYYHICGARDYIDFSSMLYFALITMCMINEKTKNNYEYDTDIDIMEETLKNLGYRIELVWDDSTPNKTTVS
jgi:hypothetical protein